MNETDILLAKAYGGKPKAGKKDMSWISSWAKMPPMNNWLFDEDKHNRSKSKWNPDPNEEMQKKYEEGLSDFLGDSDEFEF